MALGIPGSDPSDSAGAIFALFAYVSETLEIYSESVRQVAENYIPSFYFGDSEIGPVGSRGGISALFSRFRDVVGQGKSLVWNR